MNIPESQASGGTFVSKFTSIDILRVSSVKIKLILLSVINVATCFGSKGSSTVYPRSLTIVNPL